MHPGPVNRGVELSGEVVDSPQAVITAQVEAGVVVRMAVLYEVLAGARAPGARPPGAAAGAGMTLVTPRRRARATCVVRGAHVLDPRAGIDGAARRPRPRRRDRRARRARQRSTCPTGAEVVDGAGRHLLPGLRRPARAPAHARPGAQGGPRDRHPRRRRRRLLRRGGDAEHRPGRRQRAASCARCATPPRATRASPVGFMRRDHARAAAASELTEMAELRDEGALGFTDDGKPVV